MRGWSIAGIAPSSKARPQAAAHGRQAAACADRVRLLGVREDIPELMAAADLLVHPARTETTGTVILEAIVNGLPVIASAVCGYAEHVARADAGAVLPEPFSQDASLQSFARRRTRKPARAMERKRHPLRRDGRRLSRAAARGIDHCGNG